MRQVGAVASSMLARESLRSPYHCGVFLVCADPGSPRRAPAFEEVLAGVGDRLPDVTVLRQRLVDPPWGLDRPFWVDDRDFDLEFHVRPMWLPKPGSWSLMCTGRSGRCW